MGVRLRTTLTATAAVAVALCLASVALFSALDASLADSTRKMAMADAKAKAALVLTHGGSAAVRTPGPPGGPENQQTPGRGDAPPPGDPGGTPPEKSGKVVFTEVVVTGHGPVTVMGTASTAPATAAMATLRRLLIPGVPCLLGLVALFTWLSVGRVLRPVSAIRAKVADITAYDLHERVPEPDTRDEVAALARTVNATLDRLRTAVEAHRQFVADAAHELRSPLAVLRTRLELAAPQERQLAADALDDVARIQSLTSDLLLLARLDAREPLRAARLDLARLVADEASRTRPRPDVGVRLGLAPGLLVDGSADRLRRLVANLVDNAVRHAATSVEVTLTARDGQAVLDIADDGPGIPPEHHTTVFDRFTRLDHARARDTGGSGLGLAIARDIARAHQGTLRVVPQGAGARLRTTIPLPRHPAVRTATATATGRRGMPEGTGGSLARPRPEPSGAGLGASPDRSGG
ncbi:sensor histidine kinase [Peterkaempfera griseoplana]|uniref:sensor histidine kinase n=1 Tax=Peterkaempfera griseoplana TaxID=66896 RepID=UPI0007C77686|nr:HAMP domain-containing sensor histidine kinase [Peterkaempfera griseoplana]